MLAKVKEQNRLMREQKKASQVVPVSEVVAESAENDKIEKKQKKAVKPAPPKVDKNIVDYSDRFNSFYDIFVGMQIDYKNFDLAYNVRETRNVYASFVNLLDTNAVVMQQKH